MKPAPSFAGVLAILLFSACASTTQSGTRAAALAEPDRGTTQQGLASWYGAKFNGRPTASGEIYDMNRISAAHKQLPFGTVVEVENQDNGRKLRVPINDRGPFVEGRIIDLSLGAARKLDMFGAGLARVRIRVVKTAPDERRLPISYPARGGPPERQRNTAPSRPAASAARRSDPVERSGFTIQAGAFRQRSSAANLARRLRGELGLDKVRIRKEAGLYRVQIERRRRKGADIVQRKLKKAGIAAIILR